MRRGWAAGPTDDDLDETEARLTQARIEAISGSIDRQAIAAVLQSEYARHRRAIPVRLVGPAEIHSSGVKLGGFFSRLLAAAPAGAVQLFGEDPRRASAYVAVESQIASTAAFGRTQAEANDANAWTPTPNSGGPYLFHFTDALWCRATLNAIRVSVALQEWTR